jgi:hypothetical protein
MILEKLVMISIAFHQKIKNNTSLKTLLTNFVATLTFGFVPLFTAHAYFVRF